MAYFLMPTRYLKYEKAFPPPASEYNLELRLTLYPPDAFGIDCEARTTCQVRQTVGQRFNARSGKTGKITAQLIQALDGQFDLNNGITVKIAGNIITFSAISPNKNEIESLIIHLTNLVPTWLALYLKVPRSLDDICGSVNDTLFGVELTNVTFPIVATERDQQYESVRHALEQLILPAHCDIRLASALVYFNQALRFRFEDDASVRLFSEIMLNLAKAIESIFPGKRDDVREQCKLLDLKTDFVEKRIIPILLVRNKLDVAHVRLHTLDNDEFSILQSFLSKALTAVHELLILVIGSTANGRYSLLPVEPPQTEDDLITSIRSYVVG